MRQERLGTLISDYEDLIIMLLQLVVSAQPLYAMPNPNSIIAEILHEYECFKYSDLFNSCTVTTRK